MEEMTIRPQRKAVIWNAHWQEFGGGERYASELAVALSESGHTVTLLGHNSDPRPEILLKFNIDLKKCEFREVADEKHVLHFVEEDDLFINASYGSQLRAPHQRSVLICHFPAKGPFRFFQRMLRDSSGVSIHSESGQPFLKRRGQISARGGVSAIGHGTIKIGQDVAGTETLEVASDKLVEVDYTSKFRSGDDAPSLCSTNESNALYITGDLAGTLVSMVRSLNPYLGYGQIWANSEYTAKYFWKYWKISASVVYPPVSGLPPEKAGREPKKIISVGRFFPPRGGHSKNHHLLLKAFVSLKKRDPHWQLVLLGGVSPRWEKYLIAIGNKAAKISNVRIILDADADTLRRELHSSSFFWSGTGLRAARKPERVEHFGISIVEGLSAGLIPLAFDKGGPREILADFPGLRFRSLQDLRRKTDAAQALPDETRLHLKRVADTYSREKFRESVASQIRQFDNAESIDRNSRNVQ